MTYCLEGFADDLSDLVGFVLTVVGRGEKGAENLGVLAVATETHQGFLRLVADEGVSIKCCFLNKYLDQAVEIWLHAPFQVRDHIVDSHESNLR